MNTFHHRSELKRSGSCECKHHVEGQRCDRCKPGFFNLDAENAFGCTPCFCFGHSSVCKSTTGYAKALYESVFARGDGKWTAVEHPDKPLSLAYNSQVNINLQSIHISIAFISKRVRVEQLLLT